MTKEKKLAIRLAISFLASNIGIAFISYAGYKLGYWDNKTMWRVMMADGVYLCFGSFINATMLIAS